MNKNNTVIKMIALILGGGSGSRLYPLTWVRSKPAVPVGGKYRLIDIPISNCINSGVKRMFVATQYNSASLNQHIKNTYQFDQFNSGFVDILAAEQTSESLDWFQGTADAVRQSIPHMRKHDYDYILILSGDQLYQMDFERMARQHVDGGAEISIATIPVNADDAEGFGIMKVDAANRIDSFVEKPSKDVLPNWKSVVSDNDKKNGKEYLASMGIYIFNRSVLEKALENNPDDHDFGKQIIPKAIEAKRRVNSYSYNGYWADIGNIKSFFEANLALTDPIPQFNLFDEYNQIYTRPRLLAPAKINGTTMNRVLVAEACMLNAKLIEHSVIGIRSRIGRGSIIKNAIIIGNYYIQRLEELILGPDEIPMGIGNDCIVENAIIDRDCQIGNNVIIRGGDSLEDIETDMYCVKEGIIVIKKGQIIPDGTVIGK